MAYNHIGASYSFQGNIDEAIKYYKLSEKVYQQANISIDEQFNIKLNLGRAFVDLGNYIDGIDYLMQALKIANRRNNHDNLSLALFSISQVYFDMNKLDESLYFYGLALNYAKRANNSLRISQVLGDIGNVFFLKNDYNNALKYYKKSKSEKEKINDLTGISTALINIGNVYENIADSKYPDDRNELRKINYQTAIEYYKRAYELANRLNLKKNLSLVLNNIGLLNIKTGNATEGIANCKKSLEIAEQTGTLIRIRDACECLYLGHKELKQHERALYYYEKFSVARDSIFSEENLKKINRLQFEQELEMKQAMRKAEIQKQQELTEIEIKQQKFRLRISLVIIALLLFSTSFLMFQRNKIRQKNIDLVEKNLELMRSEAYLIETQKNMHSEIESSKKSLPASTEMREAKKKSDIRDEQTVFLSNAIERLLTNNKIFLDPDLTLQVLSDMLNSNSSYVSRAINETYGKNFNSVINELRVKEARRMLADQKYNHLTIEGIAREVGFNSIPSFNNAFKKFTGLSPSFFKASAQRSS